MKQAFLKIAGVKTDAQFYKLFPSEESFFKKHPEARKHIKTAQNGTDLNKNGIPDLLENYQEDNFQPINNPNSNFPKPFSSRDLEGVDTSLGTTALAPASNSKFMKNIGGTKGLLNAGVGVVQGLQMLEEGKDARNEARQFDQYSQVALRASGSRDVDANNRRRYVRPEDNIITGEELFPINGVGTNVLAKNGIQIAANGLEMLPEEGFDYSNMGAMGSQMYNGLTGNQMSGGAKIGGSVGKLAGTAIGGPIGGMIGEIGGNIIGGALDSTGKDTKKFQESSQRNIDGMMMNNAFMNSQRMNSGYMENGGELSDLEESGELQTLWGGEVEKLSHNPHHGETVMFKGQSHDESDGQGNKGIGINYGDSPVEVERGEPASVLTNSKTGEENLVIFGNLKIPKFAQDILQDPKAKNKKFKNYVADLSKEETRLNKYMESSKNTINSLEGNTSFDKLELESNNLKVKGSMMKLKDISDKKHQLSDLQNIINDTAEENGLVADDLAKGKITKDKSKMDSLKEAMNGYAMPKAQGGITTNGKKVRTNVGAQAPRSYIQPGTKGLFGGMSENNLAEFLKRNTELFKERNIDLEKVDFKSKLNTNWKPGSKEKKWTPSDSLLNVQKVYNEEARKHNSNLNTDQAKADYLNEDGYYGEDTNSINASWMSMKSARTPALTMDNQAEINAKADPEKTEANRPIVNYKRNLYMDAFNQVLPFIRPSNATPLDGNQLLGEMYGMSSNQLEPVQSQNFRPDLRTPYDISYQDQLNEITAGQRAAQRATMNSPEVQSDMAATAYNAKSKILADQFRANQGFKEQIYSGNTATLNNAQATNLTLNDTQYTRQETAKSNTKAINQALLNSISSKYQQNKLENRTLGIQENMYNYRFDRSGRAINMNGFYQPNVDQSNNIYDKNGKLTHTMVYDGKKFIGYKKVDEGSDDGLSPVVPEDATPGINPNIQNTKKRNGGYITNGSIVRSLK